MAENKALRKIGTPLLLTRKDVKALRGSLPCEIRFTRKILAAADYSVGTWIPLLMPIGTPGCPVPAPYAVAHASYVAPRGDYVYVGLTDTIKISEGLATFP